MTASPEQPDLLVGPPVTHLTIDPAAASALRAGATPETVASRFPDSSLAWATLAERSLEAGAAVASYAYARTGYHRGLDQLRRAGWRGHGSIPWSHEPNQGFLRALAALSRAAAAIGEPEEAARCRDFLAASDPEAADVLGLTTG
jgi:hypothetical protein